MAHVDNRGGIACFDTFENPFDAFHSIKKQMRIKGMDDSDSCIKRTHAQQSQTYHYQARLELGINIVKNFNTYPSPWNFTAIKQAA